MRSSGVKAAPDAGLGPTTVETLLEDLREAIVNGDWEPDKVISQAQLAVDLGVSRTPLREVLRTLQSEGLVTSRGARRTLVVSPLSMTDLDELYAVRITNEAIAMKLTVPTLRDAQFKALDAEMATMIGQAGQPPARNAHQRFHDILHGGVGPRMRELLHSLYRQAERYRRSYDLSERSTREVKQAEHAAIVDACRRGAEVEAADLLVDHLASVALDLMAAERYAPRVLPLAIAQAKAETALRLG